MTPQQPNHCTTASTPVRFAANCLHRPAGSMLGFLFAIITLKLSLGSAGIIPGLGVPAGLISFALLKGWTSISSSMGLAQKTPRLHNLLFKPFLVQENSVMQVHSPCCRHHDWPAYAPHQAVCLHFESPGGACSATASCSSQHSRCAQYFALCATSQGHHLTKHSSRNGKSVYDDAYTTPSRLHSPHACCVMRLPLCLSHFQTFILSISGVAFTGGFGTYLTGMSYQTYLNLNRWGRMGHNMLAWAAAGTYAAAHKGPVSLQAAASHRSMCTCSCPDCGPIVFGILHTACSLCCLRPLT